MSGSMSNLMPLSPTGAGGFAIDPLTGRPIVPPGILSSIRSSVGIPLGLLPGAGDPGQSTAAPAVPAPMPQVHSALDSNGFPQAPTAAMPTAPAPQAPAVPPPVPPAPPPPAPDAPVANDTSIPVPPVPPSNTVPPPGGGLYPAGADGSKPPPAPVVDPAVTQADSNQANAPVSVDGPNVVSALPLKTRIAAAENGPNGNTYSFLPSTFAAFVASPANTQGFTTKDIGNPKAQEAAYNWNMAENSAALKASGVPVNDDTLSQSWLLGPKAVAAFTATPNANAYDIYASVTSKGQADQAFSTNGKLLQKDMTAGQVLQAAHSFYRNPGNATAVASSGDSTPADKGNDVPNGLPSQLPGMGASGLDMMGNFQIPQVSNQDRLFALASGLLQGGTLGQGLGKGLANLTALQQQDRENQLRGYQANAQVSLENSRAQNLYNPKPVGQPFQATDPVTGKPIWKQNVSQGGMMQQVTLPGAPQAVSISDNKNATNVNLADARLQAMKARQDIVSGIQQQRVDLANQALQGRLSGNIQGAGANAVQGVKADRQIQNTIQARYSTAPSEQGDLQTLIQQASDPQSNGVFGPGFVKDFQRYMANQGLPISGVTPQGVQMDSSLLSRVNSSDLKGFSSAIGGRLTDNDVRLEQRQVLGMNTDPKVILPYLQRRLAEVQHIQTIGDELNNPDVQAQIGTAPGAVARYVATRQNQMGQAQFNGGPSFSPQQGGGFTFNGKTASGTSIQIQRVE